MFNYYFDYSNPNIKRLRDASDEKNKHRVELIHKKVAKLKKIVKNTPKDDYTVEKNQEIIDIVEKILELNSEKQPGRGLKILTPDQMLSRLPITLA